MTYQEFTEYLNGINALSIIHITNVAPNDGGFKFMVRWLKLTESGREDVKDEFTFQSEEEALQSYDYAVQYFQQG